MARGERLAVKVGADHDDHLGHALGTGPRPIGGDLVRTRVGLDLTDVREVVASLERFGERYTDTLFTDRELADSAGHPQARARSLAARFAAKEATIKVLGGATAPSWRSMEVVRSDTGAPTLALMGEAEQLATDAGVIDLSVSLSHEGDLAAAVVIALLTGAPGTPSQTATSRASQPDLPVKPDQGEQQ